MTSQVPKSGQKTGNLYGKMPNISPYYTPRRPDFYPNVFKTISLSYN